MGRRRSSRDAKYPAISNLGRAKWRDVVTRFDGPPAIRKVICTTSAIEPINGAIRKFTRNHK